MFIDHLNKFSNAQAITADAISDVLDRGSDDADITVGDELTAMFSVDAGFNTLTSLTVTFESAENAALSTNPVVHARRSFVLADGDLAAGKTWRIGKLGGPPSKRFLGFRYDVVGTNPTTGAVTSWIGKDVEENPAR